MLAHLEVFHKYCIACVFCETFFLKIFQVNQPLVIHLAAKSTPLSLYKFGAPYYTVGVKNKCKNLSN